MNNPEYFYIKPEQITAEKVQQRIYHVSKREKFSLLLGLLKREGWDKTVMFINTKREGEHLVSRLKWNGYECGVLTGDVQQTKRMRILDEFKKGRLPILVATDVASRGLHIDGVTHVLNYDLPQDAEDYVHRIGRTARAGAEGKAVSFACEDYAFHLEPIEEYIEMKIPLEWAEDEMFEEEKPGAPKVRYKKHDPRPGRPHDRREGHARKHQHKKPGPPRGGGRSAPSGAGKKR
jgi:ATP-dependent RNA helicase RhlB